MGGNAAAAEHRKLSGFTLGVYKVPGSHRRFSSGVHHGLEKEESDIPL